MSEIRNLTRNGETFYPLTTSSAVINEATGEGLVIDDVPTAGSNNLVKSGGIVESMATNYPFAETPDQEKLRAITAFRLTSCSYQKIYLKRIWKKAGSNQVYNVSIRIGAGGGSTYRNLINEVGSRYTEPSPSESVYFVADGVEGFLNIDWSKLSDGDQIESSANNGVGVLLDSGCYPNKEVTDPSFSYQGIPADALAVKNRFNQQTLETYPYSSKVECPVTDIWFKTYDKTKKYYVKIINRAYVDGQGRTIHSIVINDGTSNINLLSVLTRDYTEREYNSFTVGDLSGVVYIDWSKIPSGSSATYNYELSNLCYTLSDLRNRENLEIEVVIPETINVVVGHPISVYYYNIFKKDSLEGYHVWVSGTTANILNLGDRLYINCGSVGTYNVTISIRKDNTIDIISKAITINVVAESIPTVKAIFIGDSFTAGGTYLAELINMMGSRLTLYGTRAFSSVDSEDNTRSGYAEGRSGVGVYYYCHQDTIGLTSNPFYHNGTFDFSYYISQNQAFSDVTDVFILSGPNDTTNSSYLSDYQTMVNSILAYNNNIRVHCMMPLTCNCTGYAWGIRNRNGGEEFRYFMIKYGKDLLNSFGTVTNCFVIPTHAYFDKDYNFPTTQVNANYRTPIQVEVFDDNVHPNRYGYYCMADMIFAHIVANCN